MIVEFRCKKYKKLFENFELKRPKSLKSGQMENVNEFFNGLQYFYQKVYIKRELMLSQYWILKRG